MSRCNEVLNNIERNLETPVDELAKHNLFIFALLFNREVEPNYDFTDKFFTFLSSEFQTFQEDEENNVFLLEASPRTGKTDFIVNIYLIWLLGVKERHRFLFVCSNQSLKDNLRRKVERVLKSPLFQRLFPDAIIGINNKSQITLSNENSINFTTTNSIVPIGTGYHFHFYIDFLTMRTMRSEAERTAAFDQFKGFSSRTESSPATKVVIDNQRLGVNDLSSYITKQYDELGIGITRLTFPYQFPDDYYHKLGDKEIKFEKNSYLVSRFNERSKKEIIAKMGNYVYQTQYLQIARPAMGDMVKREMFRYYTKHTLDNVTFKKGFITTDLALEAKRRSDYNVFMFWLVDEDDNLYLIDMYRHKIRGSEAEKLLYNFYLKWKDGLSNGGPGCQYITFEDTTNTKPTIQRYQDGFEVGGRKVYLGGLVRKLPRVKDKFSRFVDGLPFIQGGKMYLPASDLQINGVENLIDDIVEPFLREHESFREDMSHDHDDIVDCAADAIQEAWRLETDYSVRF